MLSGAGSRCLKPGSSASLDLGGEGGNASRAKHVASSPACDLCPPPPPPALHPAQLYGDGLRRSAAARALETEPARAFCN